MAARQPACTCLGSCTKIGPPGHHALRSLSRVRRPHDDKVDHRFHATARISPAIYSNDINDASYRRAALKWNFVFASVPDFVKHHRDH